MKLKVLVYFIFIMLFTFLTTAMHAQTFSVIHSFNPNKESEGGPNAGVTIRGNALYGATNGGGYGGVVFQLTHNGSNWVYSTLADLCASCGISSRVVFGPDGHLYGTIYAGGPQEKGTVFKLTPQIGPCRDVACYWRVNDLHDFGSGTDGVGPGGGDLIWDQQGNIYGTTEYGGSSCSYDGCGTVYELTPSGNGYTESVLYNFTGGADGAGPWAGLVLDQKGNLFGTTEGGVNGYGNVFELTDVPGVGWTEHVLYSFQGTDDGGLPFGGVIFDSAGNLYGTTLGGGSGGGGTVYELSPSGDTWTFKLLYSFTDQYYQRYPGPRAPLTMDGAGNLYGTTYGDGYPFWGSVFKLSNTQNGWVYTLLHRFDGDDGWDVLSNVSIDTDGTLYGTASCGGVYGEGVVWMIKP